MIRTLLLSVLFFIILFSCANREGQINCESRESHLEIYDYEVNEISRDNFRFANYSDEDLAVMINDMEADTKQVEDTLHVKFLTFGGAAKVECMRALRYQNTTRIDIYESEYVKELTVREFHIKVASSLPLGKVNFKDNRDKDDILPSLGHWE